MQKLFEIENLRCSYDKNYREGTSKVVLEISHLEIPRGKKVFIVGESGIGKSTILETLGMMTDTIVRDKEMKYQFYVNDTISLHMPDLWYNQKSLADFRLKNYSFIFQSTNLMKNFTAFENVSFTRLLQGYSMSECTERTRTILDELGLDHVTETRMAQELSGGQQQRLAFARAVLPDFTVLFGDEPTGNLDPENAQKVMTILSKKLDTLQNASAIIVSHDMHLATSFADIVIKIQKNVRVKADGNDEDIIYGRIDDSCVFHPVDDSRQKWTNGILSLPTERFEEFLRKK